MRILLVLAVALAIAACEKGPAPAPQATSSPPAQSRPDTVARGLPAGAIQLQRVQIMDPSGFEKPMAAATALVPVGWQTQGGVEWNLNASCNPGYTFNWQATSPDGSMSANLFPGTSWAMNNLNLGVPQNPGCPDVRATTAREYFMWLARTYRPQGHVVDYRDRPDLTAGLKQFNSTLPTMGGEIKTWVEAGEILIGTNVNGQEMLETTAAVVVFSLNRMQGVGQITEFFSGSAVPGFSFKAPNGQLNFKLSEAIRASVKSDPNWMARINKMTSENQRVALNETAKRSQIIAQTSREISEMNMQGWRNSNDTSDRMQRDNVETIRGVETYNDPQSTTGTVELSNLYNNAWRMQDGSYVLTDDPSFNPYLSLGQDGTKLAPAP